jgi:oligopeptide/dipeptide ABC transporter ATP-binding protein
VPPATPPPAAQPILSVEGLRTHFSTEDGIVKAVDDVSFEVGAGELLAIVGESGSGKSVTALSIMRLIPDPPGRIVGGAIRFRPRGGVARDLATASESEMQTVRGNEIGMIFQEPMTSLNPVFTVGDQIAEAIRAHRRVGRRAARAQAIELLERVGIADPHRRVDEYPHRLSGGMRQRVMIGMALACEPDLLIADEPTTALDVTIQAQILELLKRLRADLRMSVLFITHNLGVVAEIADRVAVMYAGRVVEEAPVRAIFHAPRHPYTRGLLASIPRVDAGEGEDPSHRLRAIPGTVPSLAELADGCAFASRCELAQDRCRAAVPAPVDTGGDHLSRCLRWSEL